MPDGVISCVYDVQQTFMDLRDGGLYSDPVKLGVRERIENWKHYTKNTCKIKIIKTKFK